MGGCTSWRPWRHVSLSVACNDARLIALAPHIEFVVASARDAPRLPAIQSHTSSLAAGHAAYVDADARFDFIAFLDLLCTRLRAVLPGSMQDAAGSDSTLVKHALARFHLVRIW